MQYSLLSNDLREVHQQASKRNRNLFPVYFCTFPYKFTSIYYSSPAAYKLQILPSWIFVGMACIVPADILTRGTSLTSETVDIIEWFFVLLYMVNIIAQSGDRYFSDYGAITHGTPNAQNILNFYFVDFVLMSVKDFWL